MLLSEGTFSELNALTEKRPDEGVSLKIETRVKVNPAGRQGQVSIEAGWAFEPNKAERPETIAKV